MTNIRTLILLTAAASAAAHAQQHDLSLLAGGSNSAADVQFSGINSPSSLISVASGAGVSVQVSYAYRLLERSWGDLCFDAPVARTFSGSATIRSTSASASVSEWYFTPGVRLRFNTRSRLTPYAVAGGGFAWYSGAKMNWNASGTNVGVFAESGPKPAFGFGGGLGFRITKVFGLRADIRDFVVAGSNVDRRNHVVYSGGVGFTF
jgi:hypothetical protein